MYSADSQNKKPKQQPMNEKNIITIDDILTAQNKSAPDSIISRTIPQAGCQFLHLIKLSSIVIG
jgi:hypothetical protein